MTIEAAENAALSELRKIIAEAPSQFIYFKGKNRAVSDPSTPTHVVAKFVSDRLKNLNGDTSTE